MRFCKYLLIPMIVLSTAGCAHKPKQLTDEQRDQRISKDMANMTLNQEPIAGPVTMYEAMARAMHYNLDHRLKLMESMLKQNELRLAAYDMLPTMAADAGYVWRSNQYVSFSENAETGQKSDALSTSEDQSRRVAKLETTWNVLDFGVSYINTKQKGDTYLIAQERQRKMMQNVIRDVRFAYWRAVGYQRLQHELKPLKTQVQQALDTSKKAQDEKLQSPLETLKYQKALLESLREIATLQRDAENAKMELAALMNVKPGSKFTLVEPATTGAPLPKNFPTDIKQLEYEALMYRPELREEDYRTRIAVNEVRKARLRMLPGIEANAGWNFDSNSFLMNSNWAGYGLRLTWNLLNLVSGPQAIKTAKSDVQVAHFRRMALSMAIMTQVDIAYLRYAQAQKELRIITHLKTVDHNIYGQMQKEYQADKASQLELIRSRMEMILSQLRFDMLYADWQNSGGQLMSSIGYNPEIHLKNGDTIKVQAQKYKEGIENQKHIMAKNLKKAPSAEIKGKTVAAKKASNSGTSLATSSKASVS